GPPTHGAEESELLNEIATYVMALHQASKNAPVLAGETGRLGHVTRRSAKHFFDVTSFEGCNCTGALLAKIAAQRLLGLHSRRQIGYTRELDLCPGTKHDGPLQHVVKLAHIARPVVRS